MKNLKVLFLLGILVSSFVSCSKEEVNNEENQISSTTFLSGNEDVPDAGRGGGN